MRIFIYIILLLCIANIAIKQYFQWKNTKTFVINANKGVQKIVLFTNKSMDNYSIIHGELKGKISEDVEVLLSRRDTTIVQMESFTDSYKCKLKKGIIDTSFTGDWYTNKAILILKFPPKSSGKIEGYIHIE